MRVRACVREQDLGGKWLENSVGKTIKDILSNDSGNTNNKDITASLNEFQSFLKI